MITAVTPGNGLSGLANLGNTCFMNAALQCLSNVPPLTQYLIGNYDKINARWINCAKSGNPMEHLELFLLLQYARLVREIWKENVTIAPKTFKYTLERINQSFRGYRQHDSQELLISVMEILHSALKTESKPETTTSIVPSSSSSSTLEQKATESWNAFLKQNGLSILVSLFWGQLLSVVTCVQCKHVSHCFDPYSYLSLPIPTTTKTPDILDCLSFFEQEESLEGINSYECERCKTKTKANKIMGIWSLPQYLLVYLKRFKSPSEKNNTAVSFSMENFKFGDWAKNPRDQSAKYDLRAICCHVGSLYSGHYYAYSRNPNGQWYKYDDTTVTRCTPETIQRLTCQPYFFVYEKNVEI